MTLPAQNHYSAGILTSCMDLTKHALDPSAPSSRGPSRGGCCATLAAVATSRGGG